MQFIEAFLLIEFNYLRFWTLKLMCKGKGLKSYWQRETLEANTPPPSVWCYSKAVISGFVFHNPRCVTAGTAHRLTDVFISSLVPSAHKIRLLDGMMGNCYVPCVVPSSREQTLKWSGVDSVLIQPTSLLPVSCKCILSVCASSLTCLAQTQTSVHKSVLGNMSLVLCPPCGCSFVFFFFSFLIHLRAAKVRKPYRENEV